MQAPGRYRRRPHRRLQPCRGYRVQPPGGSGIAPGAGGAGFLLTLCGVPEWWARLRRRPSFEQPLPGASEVGFRPEYARSLSCAEASGAVSTSGLKTPWRSSSLNVRPDSIRKLSKTCRFDWHQIWYHEGMDASVLLQEARRRSGLSRRKLAQRGGTSASTLSAYESGASDPSVATLERLLRAAGYEAEVTLRPTPPIDERELIEKIEALFSFVDALPRRRRGPLEYPVFGTSAASHT
jgi:transcriptional regulator with XRE-family HTH domain